MTTRTEGIGYLAEGIRSARDLSDGWFLLANLIEYVEANYRAWATTGDASYSARDYGQGAAGG